MAMRDKIEHAIQNQPCTVKDLKSKFGGDRGSDRKVMEAVDQLVHEAVICQRQGVFFTVRSGRADKALLCKVVKLGKNFAFVMLEDGTSDIFIPGRFTRGAMPGDMVLVEKFEHPRVEGSDEGEILAILEEKNDLVGTARRIDGRLKFVPDDCPAISMQMMRDCEGGAKDGDKVAVEILQRGNRQEDHRVGVAMRFGSSDEAKRCAKALLYAQDIRSRFPDKVREEAKKLENAEVSEKDTEGRMDLRALPIFTIDSAETKDIDDAISLTKTPEGGFELGVHIADVSNYVKPGSELDNEAFNRATSVYYADQVVPMLPKQLSNGICSLNEGVLRLAFSCLMHLDKDGNLIDYRFVKSVIRSRVKGVYSEINALLAGSADDELKGKYHEVLSQLPAMKELYGHRARLRKERGCMDIESGEVKLILDENGRCIDVKKRTSGESESMIEEFMLLANQCAAHFACVKQIPFVYRVHEEPNAEKLERLHTLLQACGINDHFAKDVPTPKELSAILEGVRGGPYEQIINTGMLRCMSKAVYEEKPKGHYGLVLKDYAHFTSPIRRYADLVVHRSLNPLLASPPKGAKGAGSTGRLEEDAEHISETERISASAEKDANRMKLFEWLEGQCYADHPEVHEALVTETRHFGVLLEIPRLQIKGLVKPDKLPGGRWVYEAFASRWKNDHGSVLCAGLRVPVIPVKVDREQQWADFAIVSREKPRQTGKTAFPAKQEKGISGRGRRNR